jgi:hypothetical protein
VALRATFGYLPSSRCGTMTMIKMSKTKSEYSSRYQIMVLCLSLGQKTKTFGVVPSIELKTTSRYLRVAGHAGH